MKPARNLDKWQIKKETVARPAMLHNDLTRIVDKCTHKIAGEIVLARVSSLSQSDV